MPVISICSNGVLIEILYKCGTPGNSAFQTELPGVPMEKRKRKHGN